jgi:hypothetical protein
MKDVKITFEKEFVPSDGNAVNLKNLVFLIY